MKEESQAWKKPQTFIHLYSWIVCAQWITAFCWAGCSLREERLFQHMIGGGFILRKYLTKPWLNAFGNKGFFIRRRLSWISEHLVQQGSEEESWDMLLSHYSLQFEEQSIFTQATLHHNWSHYKLPNMPKDSTRISTTKESSTFQTVLTLLLLHRITMTITKT